MSVNVVVSVWLRFTNSAACAALRMPRRPASQETTTATRAQSVAAATRQRWQQQQQTAKAKREKKTATQTTLGSNGLKCIVVVVSVLVASSLPLVHVVVYCLLAYTHTV